MSTKWAEDQTLLFVQEYKRHECLWNRRCDTYKNKQARDDAYRELQEVMNIPGFGLLEVKMKIKNLRSTYLQELKKIEDSRNSGFYGENCYVPTVKWFKEMDSFLPSRKKKDVFYIDEQNKDVHLDEVDEFYETPMPVVVDMGNDNSSNIQESEQTQKKWKAHLRDINIAVKELKELRNMVSRETNYAENEFDIFGKHIAAQLKQLPLEQALLAQHRIQSFLTQFRLDELRHANSFVNDQKPAVTNTLEGANCDPLKLEIV